MLVGPALPRAPVRRRERLSHGGQRVPTGTRACVPPADRHQSGHGSCRTTRPAPARPGARAQSDAIHDQSGRRRSAVRHSRSRSGLHYATALSPHHRTSTAPGLIRAKSNATGPRWPVALHFCNVAQAERIGRAPASTQAQLEAGAAALPSDIRPIGLTRCSSSEHTHHASSPIRSGEAGCRCPGHCGRGSRQAASDSQRKCS